MQAADTPPCPAPCTTVVIRHLGLIPYEEATELQKALVARIREDAGFPEQLLLLEHPPVFTIGRSGRENHLLAGAERLRREGISVHMSERGGDITYHGPGQLVAYPILRLKERRLGVRGYLRDLEEVVIRALSTYNIRGERDERYTGVWIDGAKVCAIGVAVRRWISFHGLALNVDPRLGHFDLIVPCGIRGRAVTSLAAVLGRTMSVTEVAGRLEHAFEEVFSCRLLRESPGTLGENATQESRCRRGW